MERNKKDGEGEKNDDEHDLRLNNSNGNLGLSTSFAEVRVDPVQLPLMGESGVLHLQVVDSEVVAKDVVERGEVVGGLTRGDKGVVNECQDFLLVEEVNRMEAQINGAGSSGLIVSGFDVEHNDVSHIEKGGDIECV